MHIGAISGEDVVSLISLVILIGLATVIAVRLLSRGSDIPELPAKRPFPRKSDVEGCPISGVDRVGLGDGD